VIRRSKEGLGWAGWRFVHDTVKPQPSSYPALRPNIQKLSHDDEDFEENFEKGEERLDSS
jgi:hypothetical protein